MGRVGIQLARGQAQRCGQTGPSRGEGKPPNLKGADLRALVELELDTGRTHQIRAQFAAAGHPLLGDGKYGRERDNKKYGRSFQALYSYKLAFTFPTDAGLLEYLRGRVFTVEQVDFVAEYFPTGERV